MNEALNQTEWMNELLDRYEALLTEKQLDVMNLYYKEDLSYQEIADDLDISKSAVYDIIKRVTQNLQDYEHKLGLARKQRVLDELLIDLRALEASEVDEAIRKYEENLNG